MIRAALVLSLTVLLVACSDPKPARGPAARATTEPAAIQTAEPPPLSIRRPSATGVDLEPQPPYADQFDLARRYRGLNVAPTALTQPPPTRIGDQRRFWVYDLDATRALEISATLVVQSEHADMWVQDGQSLDREDVEKGARQFESEVYPQVTARFGFPASAPDGSPGRIAILHFALRGAAGYFASGDQLPRSIEPFSNEQQIVYLYLGQSRPGSSDYPGLLAHEFQHLVHQQLNTTPDAWLNEGLSEVADELLGGRNSFLRRFETAPDTQLNNWPADDSVAPSYGAAHSFLRYMLRRYGGLEGAQRLAAQDADGINSVERYLRNGGFGVGFLDVFADWVVANLLDEEGNGPFSQPDIQHHVRSVDNLPRQGSGQGSVHQFAARYLEVVPDGHDLTLRFSGSQSVPIVPAEATSGRGLWWSNRGDSIDATLTRSVDLRGVQRATLRYKLWYEIERDYDYAYVSVSTDGGQTWKALPGRNTVTRDPLRIAYGPGYSGVSGGGDRPAWVDEEVDLSAYAGSQILLRFEYVTDQAASMNGLAIDDISIPEIGWSDDAESDGDWRASGFERLTGPLTQTFLLQLVEEGDNGSVSVRRIPLSATNEAEIPINRSVRRATLVVSGITLGTTTPASYKWQVGT